MSTPSSALTNKQITPTDTDRGTRQCGPGVGSEDHEVIDANTFADWQIDYLKEDSCSASTDEDTAFEQYGKMRDALNKTGRPIVFSLCGWNPWYAPKGKVRCQKRRIKDGGRLHWWCLPSAIPSSRTSLPSLFTAIILLNASHCNHALLFDPGLAPHCMQLHFLPVLYAHNTLAHNLHCNHSLHCFSMQSLSPTLYT